MITARAAIIFLGGSAGDLPDVPIAIGMTLAPLPTQGVQRSLVIAIIVDASILATHD
jgi:hypothetical protein